MIKSVHIKNFEAHADSFFEFEKGINNISGSSDNGKSSVIKALNWCLFNQPQGFAFKKHGSKGDTSVRIEFSDGTYVERVRGTKTNQYDCNGEILTALGSGVPDAVKELTKVEAINAQFQFDQFFLLQESSGEVARTLNSIVGLEIIDEALSKSGKIVSSTRNEIKGKEEQEKDFASSLENYSWIEAAEDLYLVVSSKENKKKELDSNISAIASFIDELTKLEETLSTFVIIDYNFVKTIHTNLNNYIKLTDSFSTLKKILESFAFATTTLENFSDLEEIKERYANNARKLNEYIRMSEQEINLGKLLAEDERCSSAWRETDSWLSCKPLQTQLSKSVDEHEKHVSTISKIEKEIDRELEIRQATAKIMEVITKHREKEKQIKAEIKICPICNKPFENGECC
jgi:exonuclease SbcC